MIKITARRLPNLNIPRCSHCIFSVHGEVIVVGGHTNGFVPTATAEYYSKGKWHLLNTVYEHDQAFSLPMKSGKVMIAGGHEQHLGIGQIFATEYYNPATHTFEGWGCLDKKRSMGAALELDSGKIIITGNWYHEDSMEEFDGKVNNSPVKAVTVARSYPYLFRTEKDNMMALSALDEHGEEADTILIDQLKGDPFIATALKDWKPVSFLYEHRALDSFIGNEEKGDYRYLMAVTNKKQELAIALVEGKEINILPTEQPIPSRTKWGAIHYITSVIADRSAQKGYVMGHDDDCRLYVLSIDYSRLTPHHATEPVSITLYYTEPLPDIGFSTPVLTDEGNLMMAGGAKENNFSPYSTAILLPLGKSPYGDSPLQIPTNKLLAAIIIIFITIIAVIIPYLYIKKRGKTSPAKESQEEIILEKSLHTEEEEDDEEDTPEEVTEMTDTSNTREDPLMMKIRVMMEEKNMYLNNELKLVDFAAELGVNSRYVSESIKNCHNCSFTQYVNSYRIKHAQQLMIRQPDIKMQAVCSDSGFSNETSFFRTFKAVTGMTPGVWLSNTIKDVKDEKD